MCTKRKTHRKLGPFVGGVGGAVRRRAPAVQTSYGRTCANLDRR